MRETCELHSEALNTTVLNGGKNMEVSLVFSSNIYMLKYECEHNQCEKIYYTQVKTAVVLSFYSWTRDKNN